MKICFLLQRKFAWVAHALARTLQERYGVSESCGYVQSRKAQIFLSKKTDVRYTNLLIEEDIHARYKNETVNLHYLAALEKKYGEPNLWKFLTIDRTVMMRIPPLEYTFRPRPLYTHEEMLRILQVKFRAMIEFLEKERPDAVVMSAIASTGSRALYAIAKHMGIKTLTIEPTRTKNLVTISENFLNFSYVEQAFYELQSGARKSAKQKEAEEFLKEFRTQYTTYAPFLAAYHKWDKLKFLLPQNFLRSLAWLSTLSLEYVRGLHKGDYAEESPWALLNSRIKRKLRGIYGYGDLYDEPEWSEDFAYYQLHYEPELAIMAYAPFWTDQLEVIRHIARSLPIHYKLYVREHRAMVNFRPRAFYKELKKIPNVKLINPAIDLFTLMKAAKLVTVITSTAGWEATLMGKPVITFGDVYFNKLSMVKKCTEVEKLPELVKFQLEQFSYNEKEMVNYLSAIFEESVPVDYRRLWEEEFDYEKIKADEGLMRLAGLIAAKLGLKER